MYWFCLLDSSVFLWPADSVLTCIYMSILHVNVCIMSLFVCPGRVVSRVKDQIINDARGPRWHDRFIVLVWRYIEHIKYLFWRYTE